MGFLDSLKKGAGGPTFNTQQALMTIVVGAVKADGTVTREELLRVRALCSLSPIFVANSSDEDDRVIGFADDITSQLGNEAISKAAAALVPPLRETAFAFACDMVLADGSIGEKEEGFLNHLVGQLKIDEQTAESIVGACLIRNRAE